MVARTINVAGSRFCPACEHVTFEEHARPALDVHPCGHCGAQTVAPTLAILAFAEEIDANEAAQRELETLRARVAGLESVNASLKASREELQTAMVTTARSFQAELQKTLSERHHARATFQPLAPVHLYPTH